MTSLCITEKFSMAPGHNNGDVRAFHIMSPPLFADHFYVKFGYKPFEGTVQKGNLRKSIIGIPMSYVEFEILSRAELYHSVDNYTDNGVDGEVTIYAPDPIEDEWYLWNATIDLEEALLKLSDETRGTDWLNVRYNFFDMEKIS